MFRWCPSYYNVWNGKPAHPTLSPNLEPIGQPAANYFITAPRFAVISYKWLRACQFFAVLETRELAILLDFLEALLRLGFLDSFFDGQDWDSAGAANN